MNQRKDIIDAWIAVEQFSEGDIKSDDKQYQYLDFAKVPKLTEEIEDTERETHQTTDLDWKTYFSQEMDAFIQRKRIPDKKQNQVGMVLYFGIFPFEEVIQIIRKKYGIKDTDEELKSGEKFTLSLSFDKDLNLIGEKIFLTMAGFVRKKREIPTDLIDEEDELRCDLTKAFEEHDFNQNFDKLAQDFLIDKQHFKIEFVENIENSSSGMHSFFIEDLKKSKTVDAENVTRYLNGFDGQRHNLDGNRNSLNFNPSVFYDILEPKNYPNGRFPSNPEDGLSFMQQVAVNLYLNDSNNIMSVNGPPGTGKTTLLKDIFADLSVKQAHQMLQYIQTPLCGKYKYFDKAKIAKIPREISKHSILVASSNNGAVQNIVVDLPKKKNIHESFLDSLCKVDYFTEVSNSEVTKTYNKETRRMEFEKISQASENWGMFSIEGGSSDNVNKLLDKVELMCNELQNWSPSESDEQEIINQFKKLYDNVETCKKEMQSLFDDIRFQKSKLRRIIDKIKSFLRKVKDKQYTRNLKSQNVKLFDLNADYNEVQKSNPWSNKEFCALQSELFIASLKIRKLFLWKHKKHVKAAKIIFSKQTDYFSKEDGKKLIQTAWEWINIAIPIVSSTFASFGRMFRNFEENSLGSLFIDEAGQALPQACVGSLMRCQKVMAVGDPSQIKPVLTLDSNMMNLIARKYRVDERFISNSASTQTLIDATSQYGFEKEDEEWIGVPLWVHRRSNYPMFNISNQISYQNLMVQGKDEKDAYGQAFWYDVKGKARDKYVAEQGEKLKELIEQKLAQDSDLKNHIYVITPFKNVANELIKLLTQIDFVIRDANNRATNVGTVHTFQGKEAKIVYFVLGADKASAGAARWAVSEPNIINVAATRAKEEFYVIGDKSLYASLGSSIARDTIRIMEEYNANHEREYDL